MANEFLKGCKTFFSSTKKIVGGALIVAGSWFITQLILNRIPEDINLALGILIGVVIAIIGGFLIKMK